MREGGERERERERERESERSLFRADTDNRKNMN